jgi:hypothetical protein
MVIMVSTARAQKNEELLVYFKSQRRDYVVSNRNAFDDDATRYDFVNGATHFMLDVPYEMSDDHSTPELIARLERTEWWAELQSSKKVTLTSKGLQLRAA